MVVVVWGVPRIRVPRHFLPAFRAPYVFPHDCIEMRLVNNTLRHYAVRRVYAKCHGLTQQARL